MDGVSEMMLCDFTSGLSLVSSAILPSRGAIRPALERESFVHYIACLGDAKRNSNSWMDHL